MATGEFELIHRWFDRPPRRPEVVLAVGDDAALIRPSPKEHWAITVDTLVAGVHFFPDVDPEALGYKALAVSLSDLAAMGAEPRWFTLVLALPEAEEDWLAAFARGLWSLAGRVGIDLVGGDVSRAGQLSLTIQAAGALPAGLALRRDGARPGDLVYCSGELGGAALALEVLQSGEGPPPALRRRLERPEPRLELGRRLRGLASAAIDCSDGLAADLGHLLAASGVGAEIALDALPLAPGLRELPRERAWRLACTGGDDYELIFTVPPQREAELAMRLGDGNVTVRRIGTLTADSGLRFLTPGGEPFSLDRFGHVHF